MIVGFTGTQIGMTPEQLLRVSELVENDVVEGHHGDCIGADAQFDAILAHLDIKRVIHPPRRSQKRAFCKGAVILPPKDYLDRNEDIVDACGVLIATPKGYNEELRSGTWATIRYASRFRRPTAIVYPDGRVERRFIGEGPVNGRTRVR